MSGLAPTWKKKGASGRPPDQLQQILFNLINNALAWTHPGDKITVRAREDEIEDMLGRTRPALLVEVEDTGEGMSEESIARIFETFFTAREERGGPASCGGGCCGCGGI